MSASSNAASSLLLRSRTAILIASALATACGIYYIHSTVHSDDTIPISDAYSGLHRSNAVHRRRRRTPRTSHEAQDNADSSHGESDDTDNEDGPTELRPLADGDTVVDDQIYDEYEDPPWNRQRAGQHMVQLLFRISEDATKRNSYVHRGTLCNACGVVPIRGIRYRCANCADYDLCESCESQGHHYRTHVFYKIRVPISNYAPRQLQSPFYPGDPDTAVKMLSRELTTRLTKETGLDRPEIEAYWEQWTYMANTEWREDPDELCLAMDRRTFDRCLVPSDGNRYAAPNLIHDRMFAFYDRNNDDLISFPEFLQGLAFRKSKNKLRRIFDGYDINGDGYVDRKDFLRMFRSYYVLYKNMRKDMLDSMDEHAVNSVEAHQLVHSRQPLSSAFGRDGRFGNASNNRNLGEGKQLNPDGDLEIIDGKGIVYPSGEDHGQKIDIFRDPLGRAMNDIPPDEAANYWRLMSSPPRTLESLQGTLLENILLRRSRSQYSSGEQEVPDDSEHADENDPHWPPRFIEDVDVSNVIGVSVPFQQVPRNQRSKVIEEALRRLAGNVRSEQEAITNDRMHERWRRRQFYTDEEEGAEPPLDWKEEEDVPNGETKPSEDITHRHLLSPRSRSSSKVRFAEDMDDYETRSNPSTSSRSVPERWGGMEIPDAEKDAGKDILYQVTQQAFNELLDNLFKRAEDAAIASLSSKKTRAQHRHLFTNPHFQQWVERIETNNKHRAIDEWGEFDETNPEDEIAFYIQREIRQWNEQPGGAIAGELEEIRRTPLDELLAETGYSVEHGTNDAGSADSNATPGGISRSERRGSETPSENLRRDLLESFRSADPERLQRPLPTDEDELTDMLQSFRDPTLPQFRPSAPPAVPSPPPAVPQGMPPPATENIEMAQQEHITHDNNQDRAKAAKRTSRAQRGKAKVSIDSSPSAVKAQTPLHDFQKELLAEMKNDPSLPAETYKSLAQWDWMALYKLREMDRTEDAARVRGGWARLSWKEFEDIVKLRDMAWRREKEDMLERLPRGDDGVRMHGEMWRRMRRREQEVERMVEYLGSWIELCIP